MTRAKDNEVESVWETDGLIWVRKRPNFLLGFGGNQRVLEGIQQIFIMTTFLPIIADLKLLQ